MKRTYLLGLIALLATFLFLSNALAQNYTQWRLPEGAKARFGKGWINDIEFSPSGDLVSVATTIGVWTYDVHTGNEVNLFTGDMSGANAIAYTSDGRTLAAAHWNRTVGLWDVNNFLPNAPYFTFTGHPGPIYAVAISPNGRMIASGGADKSSREEFEPSGLIRIWDLQTKELRPILRYNSAVSTIAFSSNNRWIAGGSGDGTIKVWDAGSGKPIHEFKIHKKSVWKVDFSPDSKWLLSVDLDGTCLLTNLVPPYDKSATLKQHGTLIYAASFSPNNGNNGYTFATGSADKRIRLWKTSANNNAELLPDNPPLDGHNDSVWILAFSKDGQNMASGSLDGTVRLWDLNLRIERLKLTGHTGGIKALAYTEDNRILACGTGLDGILRLWDAGTSGQLSTLLDHAGLNEAVTFSSDGRTLASGGSEDQTILLSDVNKILNTDLTDNSLLHTLTGNRDGITALALSSPARDPRSSSVPNRLVSGGKDARIHFLDVATGQKLRTPTSVESTVTALTFDPTNKSFFSGEENGTVREWNALSGMEQFNFRSSFNAITALAFSPFPRFLAIGDEMGKIRLLDFAEEREKYIFTQHTRKITSLVFAEDGDILVSGSEDGTILLWDMTEAPLNIEGQNTDPQQDDTTADPPTEEQTATSKTPQQIAKKALASTVALTVLEANGKPSGYGSGFFVRPGHIATNHHVIKQSTRIYFKLVGKETTYWVEDIVATDPTHDLALLRVSSVNIPVLSLANSDSVQIGETVYIVGNPRGWEGTISDGIVSSIRGEGNNKWIQTTAPISPGNSGGAVLNSRGEVIGVATLSYEADYAQNLNFAVPSNYLNALLSEVR